jgi:ribonuclease T
MVTEIRKRFRSFLPVVVDVETAGFNAEKNALLEVAVVLLELDMFGKWQRSETHFSHILPFPQSILDESALKFTGIDPYHPFRLAVSEDKALETLFTPIEYAIKSYRCTRAVLVGHNAWFDLSFINAAVKRTRHKSPFHDFTSFDTATLSGLVFGQTVLSKAVIAAGLNWDNSKAHSAIYDAEKTADLFCIMVNKWDSLT